MSSLGAPKRLISRLVSDEDRLSLDASDPNQTSMTPLRVLAVRLAKTCVQRGPDRCRCPNKVCRTSTPVVAVALLASNPQLIVGRRAMPANDHRELIRSLKAKLRCGGSRVLQLRDKRG
jgi:hypothetical protein